MLEGMGSPNDAAAQRGGAAYFLFLLPFLLSPHFSIVQKSISDRLDTQHDTIEPV